jgi:hypothetical protein
MPHQCVRCGTFYNEGDERIMKGCPCGGRLFFYIRKSKLEEIKKQEPLAELSTEDKKQIEQDVFDITGLSPEQQEPVVLDLEAIRIQGPGQYELDLVHLFNKEPLIIKLEEGKYVVDIVQSFDQLRKSRDLSR